MYEVDVAVYRSGNSSAAHGEKKDNNSVYRPLGNYFGYWLGLYHGLVSHFAANYTKALINLRDEDARTVHLRQETFCSNGGYET